MCSGWKGRGVQVERYKLAQQPMSFVQNEKAKLFVEASGTEGHPADRIALVSALASEPAGIEKLRELMS